MAKAAGDSVTNHRVTNRLAHYQAKPGTPCYQHRFWQPSAGIGQLTPVIQLARVTVHNKVTPPDPMAAAHRLGEVSVMMQPIRLRQHLSVLG